MQLFEKMEKAVTIFHERQKDVNREDQERYGEEGLDTEKGDILAMLISALLILVPAVIVVLLLLVGVSYLLFFH